MTRTEVDNTVSRLKAWVRNVEESGPYTAGCYDTLDDLEDLRQHDEAQAATVDRLSAALVAAAEHHAVEAARCLTADTYCLRDHMGPYHAERARALRAAAEGQS